jgi:hypothetical protein
MSSGTPRVDRFKNIQTSVELTEIVETIEGTEGRKQQREIIESKKQKRNM